MTVEWSEAALDDLDALADYIGERDPDAADRMIERIETFAERLAQFPYMHRRGRVPGTREAVAHPNYILIYRVTARAVEILSVLHTRQHYP
ncbi:MAG: addiction module antitoxin [Sphingomonadales bacterium 32-68-7]|nr:MAG: addiction module antitoxin [Sphingomonadales bacterium 12-68-11]OYX08778.1 MAG: addiction module antitoxin [Sphingomonadales bacterium 32-68-7]